MIGRRQRRNRNPYVSRPARTGTIYDRRFNGVPPSPSALFSTTTITTTSHHPYISVIDRKQTSHQSRFSRTLVALLSSIN
jgi:hypothetical protein